MIGCAGTCASVDHQHIAEIEGGNSAEAQGGVEAFEDFLFCGVFINLNYIRFRKRGKIAGCCCL